MQADRDLTNLIQMPFIDWETPGVPERIAHVGALGGKSFFRDTVSGSFFLTIIETHVVLLDAVFDGFL